MPYYMNRDKLDRYVLTRPRNICPKTALNPSAITQFAKEKPANFMEAVLPLIVQSVSVEIYENRDKSRKSTKFGIHVLESL